MKKCLLIILSLTLLASCTESPLPVEPLKIAVLATWPGYNMIFLAQEKGFFAKHGVQVTLIPKPDYVYSLNEYREGRVDGVFIVLSDAIMLNTEGIPTQVVYATDYSETGDLIVGQPNLNKLKDVKGKTISFEGFNSFSHLFVIKLLEKYGVHEGEFKAISLDASKVLEALETKKIDAGHVYGPTVPQVLAKGYKVLAKAEEISHLMVDTFVVRAEIAKERKEEIQGVVSALAEAIEFLNRSPEEGFTIIAQFANVPKTDLKSIYSGLHVLSVGENKALFKAEGNLFKGGREIIDFFYSKGALVRIPDLKQVINGQFVKNI